MGRALARALLLLAACSVCYGQQTVDVQWTAFTSTCPSAISYTVWVAPSWLGPFQQVTEPTTIYFGATIQQPSFDPSFWLVHANCPGQGFAGTTGIVRFYENGAPQTAMQRLFGPSQLSVRRSP